MLPRLCKTMELYVAVIWFAVLHNLKRIAENCLCTIRVVGSRVVLKKQPPQKRLSLLYFQLTLVYIHCKYMIMR